MTESILEQWQRLDGIDFQTFVSTAVFSAHSINAEGYLLNVSQGWADRLKYSRADMIGRKSVEFLDETSRHYAETITLPEFMRTGRLRNIRYTFIDSHGRPVPVIMDANAILSNGRFVRSFAVFRDNGIADAIEDIQSALIDSVDDLEALKARLDEEGRAVLKAITDRLGKAINR